MIHAFYGILNQLNCTVVRFILYLFIYLCLFIVNQYTYAVMSYSRLARTTSHLFIHLFIVNQYTYAVMSYIRLARTTSPILASTALAMPLISPA